MSSTSTTAAAAPPATPPHPIFLSTATAHHIHELGEVEKEITKLLQLAGSAVALLSVPELDPQDESAAVQPVEVSSEASTPQERTPQPQVRGGRARLPVGDERAEQFALDVAQYFESLDVIQHSLRLYTARLRKARIAPTSVKAPPPGFIPPSFGVGPQAGMNARGLQETRVERDAWRNVAQALERLREGAGTEDTSMSG
ncbi:hypothetical protein BKA62DRAFT_765667 [Auriculariales sp. MPI-PUGE-AT-0066]|nr:hypothetical protein BKA62DRAFT_765667 [Auriculariales sp. MPI-PUGE-AT-0066]